MIRNSNKGFTLVEAIIVIGLIVLVLAIVTNIFVLSQKSFHTGVEMSEVQQDARVCANEIIDELKFSKKVSLKSSDFTSGNYYKIYKNGSSIIIENVISGDTHSYGDYIQGLTFSTGDEESNIVQFTIQVTTGKETFEVDSSLQLLNTKVNITGSPGVIYYSKY